MNRDEGQEDHREVRQGVRFTRTHKKRSIWTWIFPLAVILAIIIFLPRVLESLGG